MSKLSHAKCNHQLSENKILEILKLHKISKTKIKIKILQAISSSHSPISVVEIHQKIGIKLCNLSTVFRAISTFKNKDILSEINLNEGFCRYELISTRKSLSKQHHHHIRCKECNMISTLDQCNLNSFKNEIEKLGFLEVTHHLEFLGICRKCAA
jgi:Fur family ferric uptake transcriptional regulator